MIDKEFFKKYQKQLLWFVNTSLGRRYFKISNNIPENKKIVKFDVNSFTWFERYDFETKRIVYKTDFRTHAKFAKRINYSISKFNFFFRNWKIPFKAGNNFYTFPIFVIAPLTTSTFYPDANPESTSVDGVVISSVGGAPRAWTTITGETGDVANDTGVQNVSVRWDTSTTTNKWTAIYRGIFLFDTSAIVDTDSIDSATLSLYGNGKQNNNGSDDPDINIYASNPASNTALVGADYSTIGSTAFSSTISYSSFNTAGYNDFALNASGLSAISKTGISKFGSRDATHDAGNTAPTWVSNRTAYLQSYNADQTGTANDPKLVVVHSVAVATSVTPPTLLMLGV